MLFAIRFSSPTPGRKFQHREITNKTDKRVIPFNRYYMTTNVIVAHKSMLYISHALKLIDDVESYLFSKCRNPECQDTHYNDEQNKNSIKCAWALVKKAQMTKWTNKPHDENLPIFISERFMFEFIQFIEGLFIWWTMFVSNYCDEYKEKSVYNANTTYQDIAVRYKKLLKIIQNGRGITALWNNLNIFPEYCDDSRTLYLTLRSSVERNMNCALAQLLILAIRKPDLHLWLNNNSSEDAINTPETSKCMSALYFIAQTPKRDSAINSYEQSTLSVVQKIITSGIPAWTQSEFDEFLASLVDYSLPPSLDIDECLKLNPRPEDKIAPKILHRE